MKTIYIVFSGIQEGAILGCYDAKKDAERCSAAMPFSRVVESILYPASYLQGNP